MDRTRLSRVNVGNLLVVMGLGGLGFSFWLPYATAERVYRVESRAAIIAQALCAAAARENEIDWTNDELSARWVAAVRKTAGSIVGERGGGGLADFRATPITGALRGQGLFFETEFYLFLVAKTPAEEKEVKRPPERPQPGSATPQPTVPLAPDGPIVTPHVGPPVPLPEDRVLTGIECYAWPKDPKEGARTVFFAPSDAKAAFTRNLSDRYVGRRRTPSPGVGRMEMDSKTRENDYRGVDDERWIYQTREG